MTQRNIPKPVLDKTPYTPSVDRWAGAKYRTAMQHIRQEKWDEAVESLHQAIEQQYNFPDAYLWLARLSTDAEKKRAHYEKVAAYIPHHKEAMRELMILRGDITREEASRAQSNDTAPTKIVDTAEVRAEIIACSSCSGRLEVHAGQAQIICHHCGHNEKVTHARGHGVESLAMALFKERAKGTKWRIGHQLLHCDNCGAERLITSKKMSTTCPFCSSNQVIKMDATDAFRQPDGIVPFELDQQQARAALNTALNSMAEKLKGIFINNKVARIAFERVYLPFWQFDVTAQIIRTRQKESNEYRDFRTPIDTSREEFTDTIFYMLYCAVDSPPHFLTNRIDNYDLTNLQAYDPKMLSGITTEMYKLDYEDASLEMRDKARRIFDDKHSAMSNKVSVQSIIQQVQFQLVLCPVWLATITEQDDDRRLALINGQTGKVVLGSAEKV